VLILSVDIYKPSWFVAVIAVAVMVCGRHGRTPGGRCCIIILCDRLPPLKYDVISEIRLR